MKKNFLLQPLQSCRTILSIGVPGAGKTFTMLECLKQWYEYGMFDEYILILPTYEYEQNDSYAFLRDYGENVTIYDSYDPIIGERLLKQQKAAYSHGKKKGERKKVFIGIDDSTHQKTSLMKDPSLIEIVTMSRHLRCNTWLIMHACKDIIPRKVRAQIAFIFIYDISPSLLESVYEEYVNDSDFRRFSDFEEYWYNEVEDLDHKCLMFDNINKEYSNAVNEWFS
jgi:GTPase SAR1 family protein